MSRLVVMIGRSTVRSRPALRILSTCGLCLIMSACGTDVVRMSEQLNPFSGSARFDPKTTGSLSKSQNSGLTPAADVGATDESVQSSGPIASAPLTAPGKASSSAQSPVVEYPDKEPRFQAKGTVSSTLPYRSPTHKILPSPLLRTSRQAQ